MERCQSCDGTYDLLNVNPTGTVVLLCMLCRTELHWRSVLSPFLEVVR